MATGSCRLNSFAVLPRSHPDIANNNYRPSPILPLFSPIRPSKNNGVGESPRTNMLKRGAIQQPKRGENQQIRPRVALKPERGPSFPETINQKPSLLPLPRHPRPKTAPTRPPVPRQRANSNAIASPPQIHKLATRKKKKDGTGRGSPGRPTQAGAAASNKSH